MITPEIMALAKEKFCQFQNAAPMTSSNVLTWEECREWSDPNHPNYDPIYAGMVDRFIKQAIAETN